MGLSGLTLGQSWADQVVIGGLPNSLRRNRRSEMVIIWVIIWFPREIQVAYARWEICLEGMV